MNQTGTNSTLDPEARYLDYERVIRELEKAEHDHELDAAGVIEKLKEAHDICQASTDRYTVKATEARRAGEAYAAARGMYLEEIKRRVELGPGRKNQKAQDRPGWYRWCAQNGVSYQYANLCISAANGDTSFYRKRRELNNRLNLKYKRDKYHDTVLPRIKALWGRLTCEEREEFLQWARDGKDHASVKDTEVVSARQSVLNG